MNCLYFALRQIFLELKDNLLLNVNWKNKIKSNEVSNFLKNTTFFSDSYLTYTSGTGRIAHFEWHYSHEAFINLKI